MLIRCVRAFRVPVRRGGRKRPVPKGIVYGKQTHKPGSDTAQIPAQTLTYKYYERVYLWTLQTMPSEMIRESTGSATQCTSTENSEGSPQKERRIAVFVERATRTDLPAGLPGRTILYLSAELHWDV
ncbi:unnamed protein product [Eruca vesicaria subsp. sativa]|uniref:Uncharacterized protein n=1 Tax=Eruca vesicaria subsp. sativa TaxID=29727 RepID=A0ABC8JRP3_ERUVS|nr:unnamed protein product [Eruca vesicaria subsp. sativa]